MNNEYVMISIQPTQPELLSWVGDFSGSGLISDLIGQTLLLLFFKICYN